jgi:hypothetical protein
VLFLDLQHEKVKYRAKLEIWESGADETILMPLAGAGWLGARQYGVRGRDQPIAQYTGTGSAARALFPADDLLDWGQLGPICPNIGQLCIPNGSVATSNKGVSIKITSPSGAFDRAQEGTSSWEGHFQTGDNVIYAGPTQGTITFTLQKAVAGIGFELSADGPPQGPATVRIFDTNGKLLSSITQPNIGSACIPACNDAPFFGFYDPSGRIASVSISPNDGSGFAENQVSLIDEPQSRFAGTPGKPNCHGQSVSALAQQFGGVDIAAATLGFPTVSDLQSAISQYCGN